jgi:hypothetical protein
MATRSNALSELTRFWLEARHGCLVQESIPVPVPRGNSDIDFLAMHPRMAQIVLPDGISIGPRLIVETKAEHDYDSKGTEFAKALRSDAQKLDDSGYIPPDAKEVYFSMLRHQHRQVAAARFGTDDFDRLFVVHDINAALIDPIREFLRGYCVHFLTAHMLLRDL